MLSRKVLLVHPSSSRRARLGAPLPSWSLISEKIFAARGTPAAQLLLPEECPRKVTGRVSSTEGRRAACARGRRLGSGRQLLTSKPSHLAAASWALPAALPSATPCSCWSQGPALALAWLFLELPWTPLYVLLPPAHSPIHTWHPGDAQTTLRAGDVGCRTESGP